MSEFFRVQPKNKLVIYFHGASLGRLEDHGVHAGCLRSSDYVDLNMCWNSVFRRIFHFRKHESVRVICVVWAAWTLFICAIRCA